MKGRELQKQQNELGVGPELVCNEAGISMSTLYKVYGDKPVRASTIVRVRHALAKIKARMMAEAEAG